MLDLSTITGFEWDDANREKNWIRHAVSVAECEEVFFNRPILLQPDPVHSKVEVRLYVLGRTNHGRALFIGFTLRNTNIRVISARDMSKKERSAYDQVIA